jgi:exodeoxyribonuclease-1
MEEIGWPVPKPFLHITGMIPAERGCISVMWPLAMHPTNKNEIIVWDLSADPAELFSLSSEEIQLRMFSKSSDLPEGVTRLPIKTIHINKSPIVISNLKTLSAERAAHWGIDMNAVMAHAAIAAHAPDMAQIWEAVFDRSAANGLSTNNDVDEDLYNGFIGNADRRLLNELRALPAEQLQASTHFQDARLDELLFRYRARNFPATLSAEEAETWEQHRAARLHEGLGNAMTVNSFLSASISYRKKPMNAPKRYSVLCMITLSTSHRCVEKIILQVKQTEYSCFSKAFPVKRMMMQMFNLKE